jgi:hypothetical protein
MRKMRKNGYVYYARALPKEAKRIPFHFHFISLLSETFLKAKLAHPSATHCQYKVRVQIVTGGGGRGGC